MEEFELRLEASRAAMAGLRQAVEAREPWPLSTAYGAEPESDWGPKEVLAHVAEMATYWPSQIEGILAAPSEPPPAFGRVSTDPVRIGRIGEDRHLPPGELFDRIDRALADVVARLQRLDHAASERIGAHPRLGEMTVEAIFGRFLVGHLEDHVRQLEEILAR
jgi:hypothetical protein